MGASNSPDLRFAKGEPHGLKRRRVKLADDKHQRKVYAAVDVRDEERCVVTGRRGNRYTIDPLDKVYHHHILQKGRDLGPTETWNLATLHRVTHDIVHQNRLTIEGNADEALTIGIHEKSVEELFGKRCVPAQTALNGVVRTLRVLAEAEWPAWLDAHAARETVRWAALPPFEPDRDDIEDEDDE